MSDLRTQGTTIHRRACHLCEAICGVVIETRGDEIISIRGDDQDPFSRGHICPKAMGLKDLHEDPDRLRQPVKKVNGQWVETTWEDAIELACEGLFQIQKTHGSQAIGVYQGNPNVHNWGLMTHAANFLGLIKTKNRFSATSVDQLPLQLMGYWMYGHQLLIPIPDIDHTDYFLMLGANPIASNGSLMTVPDVAKRIKALQGRGGKLVVIDPRCTETAEVANQHHFIQPGTDAAFLFALINCIVEAKAMRLERLGGFTHGLQEALDSISGITAEVASSVCGIPADQIRQIASDFAHAEKAVCYGRMGTCTQRHGTLCQWAIQLLNLITGNLDSVGGALVTHPAVDLLNAPGSKPGSYGRWASRVSQRPEVLGEFPSSLMSEEILTEGEGQIQAMVTVAGNPVLSTPNGQRLDQAFESLKFMVSIDLYINETSRHADVILPTSGPLEHDHYDLIFNIFGVRNQAKYSAATFAPTPGLLHDWELFNKLAECYSSKLGAKAKPSFPPQMVLDMGLQMGAYGAQSTHGLSLEKLKAHPEGIDLGPLKPSFPARLMTEGKVIQVAPVVVLAAAQSYVDDLLQHSQTPSSAVDSEKSLSLIGRRHVRSNNSWMHNSLRLVKGKNRCTLWINPADAQALGLKDGDSAQVQSRVGQLQVPVEVTEGIMPGVVSLPHGWGHSRSGVKQRVAVAYAGVSANDLTDDLYVDQVSGNAAINGVRVTVTRA